MGPLFLKRNRNMLLRLKRPPMPSCHLIQRKLRQRTSRTLHSSLGWTEPTYQTKWQSREADKEECLTAEP